MSVCDARSTRPCEDPSCKVMAHKLASWRSGSSSLGTRIPPGWRGPSRWELERRQLKEGAEGGMKLERPAGYSSTAKPWSEG